MGGDLPERVRRRPESVGRGELDDLVARATAGPDETRREALSAVAAVAESDPGTAVRVVPDVASLVESDDTEVRRLAVRTLVGVSGERPRAVERTAAVLADRFDAGEDDEDLRARLMLVLSRIAESDPAAVEGVTDVLLDGLDDSSLAVRSNAARAVAAVARSDPGAVRPGVVALANCLDAPVDGLRIDAASALAGIAVEYPGDVCDHVERLFDAANGPGERLRGEATRAVANVALARPTAIEGRIDYLLSLLDDDTDAVRNAAVEALMGAAVVEEERIVDRLQGRLVDSGSDRERESAGRALRGIALREPDAVVTALDGVPDAGPPVRREVSGILASVGANHPGALRPIAGALVAALDDPDPEVREGAAEALAALAESHPATLGEHVDTLFDHLGDGAMLPGLAVALAATFEAGVGAGSVDPSSLPVADLLAADDERVRASTCRIIGAVGSVDALDRLRERTDDPSPAVRTAALEATTAVANRADLPDDEES